MGMDGAGRRERLRPAAIAVDAALVHEAGEDFHHRAPRRSAKRVLFWSQALVLVLMSYGAIEAVRTNPGLVADIAVGTAYLLFAVSIVWRLCAAASLGVFLSRLADHGDNSWPTYTLLCPLYREANVAADLVAALERLDYPRDALDIKLLVEADDLDTLEAALAAAGAPHIEVVILPPAAPRTKPKALNVGLARARGEFLAVYDAEDRPHPVQLRAALAAFEDGGDKLARVQAPLVVDNASASWIARQFAAEYAIQFREILPLLTRLGFPLPLGGSINHFRGLM
jgi:glycosyltransferase XagB